MPFELDRAGLNEILRHIEAAATESGDSSRRALVRVARWGFAGFSLGPEINELALTALLTLEGGFADFEEAASTAHPRTMSLALIILCGLTEEAPRFRDPPFGARWITPRLQSRLCDDPALAARARRSIRAIVLRSSSDESAIRSAALPLLAGLAGPVAQNTLIAALALRTVTVSAGALARFEQLVLTHSDDEPAFHRFLEENPQIIDPHAITVWSKPNILGAKIPDFVIRRSDDTYLLIEIECPAKRLVTQGGQVSSEAAHAVAQAQDYAAFMQDRLLVLRELFPGLADPDCLVICGLEASLTPVQARALALFNRRQHRLRLIGFDAVLARARTICTNVIESDITVVAGARAT